MNFGSFYLHFPSVRRAGVCFRGTDWNPGLQVYQAIVLTEILFPPLLRIFSRRAFLCCFGLFVLTFRVTDIFEVWFVFLFRNLLNFVIEFPNISLAMTFPLIFGAISANSIDTALHFIKAVSLGSSASKAHLAVATTDYTDASTICLLFIKSEQVQLLLSPPPSGN